MKTLHQAALDRFGSEAEVAHQLRLEARRRRYAATAPGPRVFPCPGVAWNPHDYVREFEKLNWLKPINGETA